MNILRLKYFLAVAISGSFSEAAEILFTTQSAVSKQVIALEKELSAELFDRSRRRISITEQGKVVLKYAQGILDVHAAMVDELAKFGHSGGGVLAVASIPVMAHYNIPELIARFEENCPTVRMVLDECEGSDIIPAMEQRQYELAFMRGDRLEENTFDKLDLFTDSVVAVLPVKHPLSEKTQISLADLRQEKFLLLSKSTLIYQRCVMACNDAGFQPNIVYTGTRSDNIMEMVSSGMGISLMMKQSAMYAGTKDVALVPLAEKITSTISLVRIRRSHYTAAAKALWGFVEKRQKTL